jgi:hypothetical protein
LAGGRIGAIPVNLGRHARLAVRREDVGHRDWM